MNRLTEDYIKFNKLEQICYDAGMSYARELMQSLLATIDKELMINRDKSVFRARGARNITIKTLMGEVDISRQYYRYITEWGEVHYTYLLDEVLNMDLLGKISVGLIRRVCSEIAESSYRATANGISFMTGQSISHSAVWNIIQDVGERLNQESENRIALMNAGAAKGTRTVPVLQEEYDGVWINMQGEDRPSKGSKREMKLSLAYEGVRRIGINKEGKYINERINPVYSCSFESASKFYDKKEGKLASIYNLDEVNVRLISGDGGGWVQGFSERACEEVHVQLDPFHIMKAITSSCISKEAKKAINTLLEEQKIPEMINYIKVLYETEPDEKNRKKIIQLLGYLSTNKEKLVPISKRKIVLPEREKDTYYGNMGSMEAAVGSVIALRMKKRKASFSEVGATNLGMVLCLKREHQLDGVVSSLSGMIIPLPEESIKEFCSAHKIGSKIGTGYEYPVHGGKPFRTVSTTNGRKAVQIACGYYR